MRYADSTPHSVDDVADATDAVSSAVDGSPSKVNFTSRYKKKDRVLRDELEEYFRLPCEDFDGCKPVQWWVGRRAQFPNLYCLARDLLTIPGMFAFIFLCNLIIYVLLTRFCGCSRANILWGA
jgi:hypothetical protein